jgi:hypothetical protein
MNVWMYWLLVNEQILNVKLWQLYSDSLMYVYDQLPIFSASDELFVSSDSVYEAVIPGPAISRQSLSSWSWSHPNSMRIPPQVPSLIYPAQGLGKSAFWATARNSALRLPLL